MKLAEIERQSESIHALIKQTYPSLKPIEIAALCGYLASYILNGAQNHPVFKTMGSVCYDILTFEEDDDRDKPIGTQANSTPSSDGESKPSVPRSEGS